MGAPGCSGWDDGVLLVHPAVCQSQAQVFGHLVLFCGVTGPGKFTRQCPLVSGGPGVHQAVGWSVLGRNEGPGPGLQDHLPQQQINLV